MPFDGAQYQAGANSSPNPTATATTRPSAMPKPSVSRTTRYACARQKERSVSTAPPLAQKPGLGCRRGGSSIRAPSRERASAASATALALTATPIAIRMGTTSGVIARETRSRSRP